MRFERLFLHHVEIPIVEPFSTAFGTVNSREMVIVRAETTDGETFSECPVLPTPWYTYETIDTAVNMLMVHVPPMLAGRTFESPGDVYRALEPMRGHPMVKSSLDTAAWHIFSNTENRSVSQLIGGSRSSVECGLSVGFHRTADDTVAYIAGQLRHGFRRLKLKIKPGWDVEPVSAVHATFPNIPLTVDCNGSYTPDLVDDLLALEKYGVQMVEQPFRYDDLLLHADLQSRTGMEICLDESLSSISALDVAIRLRSCRSVNIKMARMGGLSQALIAHNRASDAGLGIWCGGMFETAIGQTDCIALASLPGFSWPADIGPSERYFQRDLVDSWIAMEDGFMPVPTTPGLGFEVNVETLRQYTSRTWEVVIPR